MSEPMILDHSAAFIFDPDEPYGVQHAVKAVRRDACEATGHALRHAAARPPDCRLAIVVERDGRLAQAHGLGDALARDEAFVLRSLRDDSDGHTILISGNGERGVIYGLYHFSETVFGSDPCKHITGFRPELRQQIEVAAIDYCSPAPAFRLRGWHIETCGLWGSWATSHENRHRHFARVFETLLRCGGNMVKPDTNRPESMEIGLAQKMGLLITQEHAEPLGCGTWELRSDDPGFNYLFDDFPEVFIEAWDDAMRRYPDPAKVIWTLNYRGAGDQPFYVDSEKKTMPRYDTDAKRGAGITRVLAAQQELVNRRFGDLAPQFIHNLWMEGNRLMAGGHVQLPEDTSTVWSDNMYGTFRSAITFGGLTPDSVVEALPPPGAAGRHGTYYHVAGGDFCAPFLNAYVPLSRIEEEYAKVWERGMTDYLLVNVQYVAPQLLSVAAFADLWRYPERWFGPAAEGARGFLQRWCRRRFGATAADAARCYDLYYGALTRYAEQLGYDDYIVGGEGYARAARAFVQCALNRARRQAYEATPDKFYWGLPAPMALADQMTRLYAKTAAAVPKWQEAVALAESVAARLDGRARALFNTDVLCQMMIFQAFNHYLRHIIDGVRAYEKMAWQECREQGEAAMRCIDEVRRVCGQRDWGEWDKFWDLEHYFRIACLPMAYDHARLLRDAARGMQGFQSVHWLSQGEWCDANQPQQAGWRDRQSGPVARHPHRPPPEDLYGA